MRHVIASGGIFDDDSGGGLDAMIADTGELSGGAYCARVSTFGDTAGYDARWVARFVSAYVNSDPGTGEALFGAALADGQLPACLVALADSAVATLQRRA